MPKQSQKQKQTVIVNIGNKVVKKKRKPRAKKARASAPAPQTGFPEFIRTVMPTASNIQTDKVLFQLADVTRQLETLREKPPVNPPAIRPPLAVAKGDQKPFNDTLNERMKLSEEAKDFVGNLKAASKALGDLDAPASGGGLPRQPSVQERIQEAIKRTRAPNRPLDVRLAEQEAKTEKLRQQALKTAGMTAEQVGFERQDTVLAPVDVPITLDDFMRGTKSRGAAEAETQTEPPKPKKKFVIVEPQEQALGSVPNF